MEKWMEIAIILLLALAVACTILLSGCTAPADSQQYAGGNAQAASGNGQPHAGNGSTQGFGNRSGMMRNGNNMTGRGAGAFGNMTDAQRQQMAQAFATACDGKAAGDACAVQASFGTAGARGEMNGTCSARNGTLSCTPSGMMGRRGAPGNGTAPQQNP